MTNGTSDFIISIAAVLGAVSVKFLPKRLRLIWKILIMLGIMILISIIGHLIAKLLVV